MYNFANSLHKDQARQIVGPDLDPNRLTMTDISERFLGFKMLILSLKNLLNMPNICLLFP